MVIPCSRIRSRALAGCRPWLDRSSDEMSMTRRLPANPLFSNMPAACIIALPVAVPKPVNRRAWRSMACANSRASSAVRICVQPTASICWNTALHCTNATAMPLPPSPVIAEITPGSRNASAYPLICKSNSAPRMLDDVSAVSTSSSSTVRSVAFVAFDVTHAAVSSPTPSASRQIGRQSPMPYCVTRQARHK